jgi:hypothetical protein
MKYPVAEVTWDDSCIASYDGGKPTRMDDVGCHLKSVGYLIQNDKGGVRIAETIDDDEGNGHPTAHATNGLRIPRHAVVKVQVIKKGSK